MAKKQNKKKSKKEFNKMQTENTQEIENPVEENNSSTEQEQADNKEEIKELSTEEKKEPKKEKPTKAKSNLTLIKGKVAEKGLKSFLRCGIKFTNEYQELEVDKPTLARLKAEPKLTIQVVK